MENKTSSEFITSEGQASIKQLNRYTPDFNRKKVHVLLKYLLNE